MRVRVFNHFKSFYLSWAFWSKRVKWMWPPHLPNILKDSMQMIFLSNVYLVHLTFDVWKRSQAKLYTPNTCNCVSDPKSDFANLEYSRALQEILVQETIWLPNRASHIGYLEVIPVFHYLQYPRSVIWIHASLSPQPWLTFPTFGISQSKTH